MVVDTGRMNGEWIEQSIIRRLLRAAICRTGVHFSRLDVSSTFNPFRFDYESRCYS